MTNRVVLRAYDVDVLSNLMMESAGISLRLPQVTVDLAQSVPEELKIATVKGVVSEEDEKDGYSGYTITATNLAICMLAASAKGLWTDVLPMLDSIGHAKIIASPREGVAEAWLAKFSEYCNNHRGEMLTQAPMERPAPEEKPEQREEETGAGIRLVPTMSSRPFVPKTMSMVPDQDQPELMTPAQRALYYAGADELSSESQEFKCSPQQVSAIWNHVYGGMGVETKDEQRRLRIHVLTYTMNNGCSPNAMSTRVFEISNTRSVYMTEVFKYIAQEAGTLRRFMRGMADEAVSYLEANPSFVPHWGRKNLGAQFERTIGFDYADGRTDLEPAKMAILRNALERALDRQASANRRAEFITPNEGPVQGSVHESRRSFRPRPHLEGAHYIE